ncbi:MAG: TatD family nuclease-associated radical SAM protein [Candidatus Methanomethylophilaceae archaeon]|nr:TatD family nuclease-associated radical SAM protein [Candidatus Methanomethylophilaceae archaeon]
MNGQYLFIPERSIMSAIIYRYGSRYYINMTNRCPCRCVFCVRDQTPTLGDADSLWLDREPTVQEVKEALLALDLSSTEEIVFCGYGEPTERFEDLKEIAAFIHSDLRKRVRLDTNGLGSLINGRDIVPELKGLVDSVSISLNAKDTDEYLEVTRSKFGPGSYQAVLDFISECRSTIDGVTVSIVGGSIPQESEEECARIAQRMNVAFRVR